MNLYKRAAWHLHQINSLHKNFINTSSSGIAKLITSLIRPKECPVSVLVPPRDHFSQVSSMSFRFLYIFCEI